LEKIGLRHEVSPTHHQVTVSIGGASCTQATTYTLEDLVKRADRALYKAKHSGRNRSLVDDIAIHKTILVVEQDTKETKTLIQMLTPQYNVLYTETAEEALDICIDIHPDAIIMDASIADENEERLCRQLARNLKTSAIPIVLISDTSCSLRPISDSTIGIRGCLEKPIDKEALLQKVQYLIN
jgi:PleD family two-component response regulator